MLLLLCCLCLPLDFKLLEDSVHVCLIPCYTTSSFLQCHYPKSNEILEAFQAWE